LGASTTTRTYEGALARQLALTSWGLARQLALTSGR
jgi:hypothetical protein